MYETEGGFAPQYADYPERIVASTVDDLDRYGRWLAGLVRYWNPRSDAVGELRDILDEIRDVITALNEIEPVGSDPSRFGVDMTDLPTMPFPPGIDPAFPVWAIDREGGVLVGDDATMIDVITMVIDEMNDLDPSDLVKFDDLPEPVRGWAIRANTIGVDDDGYVTDDEEGTVTWSRLLELYGYAVWGIHP